MRILFLIPSLSRHGPNVFTLNLIESLLRFTDISSEDISVFYFNETYEFSVLNFPCSVKKISFFRLVDVEGFDIVHTTMLKPDLYASIYLKGRAKVVCGLHNEVKKDLEMIYGWRSLFYFYLWRFALNRIDNFVYSSYEQESYYKSIISNESSSRVIPYGVEKDCQFIAGSIDEDAFLLDLKNNYFVLGSCGLLINRKNFKIVVDVLADRKDCAFVLIGSGPDFDDLKMRAASKGVSDRLVMLGFKENHKHYYGFFDAYVMPSFSEGFGLAMLDAIALEIPIVCSKLTIYQDYFTDSDVCYFNPSEVDSLSLALERVINNHHEMSARSSALYDRFFSCESMAKKHYNFYQQLLSE